MKTNESKLETPKQEESCYLIPVFKVYYIKNYNRRNSIGNLIADSTKFQHRILDFETFVKVISKVLYRVFLLDNFLGNASINLKANRI